MTFETTAAAVSCGIIGPALLGYGLHLRNKLRFCQSWPQVMGTITQSDLDTSDGYEIRVTYEYTVNGTAHSNTRVQFGGSTSYVRKTSAEAVLSRYPANSQVTVYYDPENPAEAVLERTKPNGLEYIVSGIVILAMMVLVILYPSRST